MFDGLRKLLGVGQQQPRVKNAAPVFEPQANGQVYVNGGVTNRPVEEDNFTFDQGGQYTPQRNGGARIDGGYFPAGQFQEDDFTFPVAEQRRNLQGNGQFKLPTLQDILNRR